MKRVLKWIGIVLGGLIGLLALALAGLYISSELRMSRKYDVAVETVAIPNDEASLARGKHFVDIHCAMCHGEDLSGGQFFEDPALGYTDATNLTDGQGGIGAAYTDADWVRAIRHGVKLDGTSVFIMPSNDFYYMNDADLGGLIAYLKTVPPVDNTPRPRNMTPLANILYALGAFGDLLYAEVIPHDGVRPPSPPEAVTAEYGEYLVNVHGCRSCHGLDLLGDKPPAPGSPLAPGLTQDGELRVWSETDFIATMRSGTTPGGRQLDGEFMPWPGLSKLTDDEMIAMWLYLQTLGGG
jgi:mono/diheme cytochrome c family protein